MLRKVPNFDHNNLMQWLQYDSRFIEKAEPVLSKDQNLSKKEKMQVAMAKALQKLIDDHKRKQVM